jgi:hypothetical protein
MNKEFQIDLIKQERDMAKAALKSCRRRVELTVLTGAIPDTEPDFVERHSQPDWDEQRDAIAREHYAKKENK